MHKFRAVVIIIVGWAGIAITSLFLFAWSWKAPAESEDANLEIPQIRIATGHVSRTSKTLTDDPNPTTPVLRVAMPKWLYTPTLQTLIRNFQEQQKVQVEMVLSDSPNAYQQSLDNDFLTNQTIDLALIPSDRLYSYQEQAFALTIDASLRGVFHRSFYTELTNPSATYIPFAIDPLMTVIRKGLWDSVQDPSLAKLQSLARTIFSTTLPLPLVLWMSETDRQLLQKWRESYPNQFISIQQLFSTAIHDQDRQLLDQLIDATSSHIAGTRNYATMRALLATNKDDSDDCNTYPAWCLLASRKSGIAIASASDVTSWELYNSGFKSYDYELLAFPNSTHSYPIRLRWRYSSKHTNHRQALQHLINTLLQQGQTDTSLVPPLLISPFLSRIAIDKSNTPYPSIRKAENRRNPIVASTQRQEETIKKRWRNELFEGRIDPNLRLYQQYQLIQGQRK